MGIVISRIYKDLPLTCRVQKNEHVGVCSAKFEFIIL